MTKRNVGWILSLYLLGIFMGALDTGIVTPARTVIQHQLGQDAATGIWMITIYTLAYAAAIPVLGKLADRLGRKRVYLIAITLFGLGSLLSGLSQDFGSFPMLIISRAIQAIGGGGILPIATAEFGTTVPKERRGLALGLVGAVYAVANIFGSSAGSLILGLVGTENWQWIFYINVPISLAIIIAGVAFLPNTKSEDTRKIDLTGITILVLMILSLLYGLRSLDWFDFQNSIASPEVYPFLLAFAILLPVLILVERRAADPALNLHFFTSRPVLVTLIVGFVSGVVMMSVVFVPQFAENATHTPTGAGGYFVILLGLASGIGAPLSGRFTDRFGPKPVLAAGFLTSAVATAAIYWWTIPAPSMVSVLVPLFGIGLGMGFFMGSPLNYMMLEHTRADESNSALATLSLVRAVGTTLAPAVMAGFLAQAGLGLSPALMDELPTKISVPALPHAAELDARFAAWKADPAFADQLKDVTFPKLTTETIEIKKGDGGSLPPELVSLLKESDVTTIVANVKTVAETQFDANTPAAQQSIFDGVAKGISSLQQAQTNIKKAQTKLNDGISGVKEGLAKMQSGIDGMTSGINGLATGLKQQRQALAGLQTAKEMLAKMPSGGHPGAPAGGRPQPPANPPASPPTLLDLLPPAVKSPLPESVKNQLVGVRTVAEVQTKIDELNQAITQLEAKQAKLISQRRQLQASRAELAGKLPEMQDGLAKLQATEAEIALTITQLQELRDAVPATFQTAKTNYLAEIDRHSAELETTFQTTLNRGFGDVFGLATLAALLAVLALLAYPNRPASPKPETSND